ncbi:hypothetical protein D3C75_1028940 [compost metagenome]
MALGGAGTRLAGGMMVGAGLAAVMLAVAHDGMFADLAIAAGAGTGLFAHDRAPVVKVAGRCHATSLYS